MLGNFCFSLALQDACDTSTDSCGGPINCDTSCEPSTPDGYVFTYGAINASSIVLRNEDITGESCGYPSIVGGWDTAYIYLEATLSDLYIDIDMVTPASDPVAVPVDEETFTPSIAPGKTDCNTDEAGRQNYCYVKKYARALGNIRVGLGIIPYLEHRYSYTPHWQTIGISIQRLDITQEPWVSIMVDCMWFETNDNSPRDTYTEKLTSLIGFFDLIARGLLQRDYLGSFEQYFGPAIIDLGSTTQNKTEHLLATYSRPTTKDDIWYDIAIGGPDAQYLLGLASPTKILRSMSCNQGDSLGDTYIISNIIIDTDFYQGGSTGPPPSGTAMPSCVDFPDYSTFPWGSVPPTASRPLADLAPVWQVGMAIHENVFTRTISDAISEGIMCVTLHEDDSAYGESIKEYLKAENFRNLMPEVYDRLEDDYPGSASEIPFIITIKPRRNYSAAVAPSCGGGDTRPYANVLNDQPPSAEYPITPTQADLKICIPVVDLMIWVDGDETIEDLAGDDFPDDVTVHPADSDRRHIMDFRVSLDFGIDLNILGCGRNLITGSQAYFYNRWLNSFNGTCTDVPYMRRIDFTAFLEPELLSVDASNAYYQLTGGTFVSSVVDAIGMLLDGILSMRGQIGYTTRPIWDPNDLQPINEVAVIGTQPGAYADALTNAFIRQDPDNADFLDFKLSFGGDAVWGADICGSSTNFNWS
jgi:hypothetical protein